MRFWVIFFLACLFLHRIDSKAQELVAEIPLAERISSPIVFTVGDSVLLAYKEATPGANAKWWWINKNGTFSAASGIEAEPEDVLIIKKQQRDILSIYTSTNKNSINVHEYHIGYRKTHEQSSKIEIAGQPIGVFFDADTVQLLAFDEKALILQVLHLLAGKVCKQNHFPIAYHLSSRTLVGLIGQDSYPSIETGTRPIKIYSVNGGIRILVDDVLFKTNLYDLRFRDNSVRLYSIHNQKRHRFISALGDSLIYRVTAKPNLVTIMTHSLEGKLLSTLHLKPEESLRSESLFVRKGRAAKTEVGASVNSFLQYKPVKLSLIAERDSEGRRILVVGDYFDDDDGTVIVPGASAFAFIASAVGTVALESILESIEWPGISAYYYVQPESDKKVFTTMQSLRSRIDRYEINQSDRKVQIKERFYHRTSDGMIAFYHDWKAKNLQIVKFRRD